MPNKDGTGPLGNGPMGRGMGPCGRGLRRGGYGRNFGGGLPRWAAAPATLAPEMQDVKARLAEIEKRLADGKS